MSSEVLYSPLMLAANIEDFLRCSLCDNRLAALSVQQGEELALKDVIDLASQAKSVYFTLSLHCRGLETIPEYRTLWIKAAEFFDQLCRIWSEVFVDSERVDTYRCLLTHLRDISIERVLFYTIPSSDRSTYRARKVE
jgi:hypothetical protein